MKIIKYLFFLILILFIGIAIYFGTQDGSFSVKETKEIYAPAPLVFNFVNNYRNWNSWNSWLQEEDIKIHYADTTTGAGAEMDWKNSFGEGQMRTLSVIPEKKIEQKMAIDGNVDSDGYHVSWTFQPNNEGTATEVVWEMQGTLSLFEKISAALNNVSIASKVSAMYTESLNNLDKIITSIMEEYSIEIEEITQYSGGFYLYTSASSKIADIASVIPDRIAQVKTFMEKNAVLPSGNLFVVYHALDKQNGTAVFSVGFPTQQQVLVPDGSTVLSGFIPVMYCLKTTLKGNYTYLDEAWQKTEDRIAENGWQRNALLPIIESYPLGPEDDLNPANWITEIFIPLDESSLQPSTSTGG